MPEVKDKPKIYAFERPDQATPGWWTSRNVIQHVDGFFTTMDPLIKMVWRQWYKNIAYLSGSQYMDYLTAGSFDLVTPKAPRNRVRAVFNELLPMAVTQKAKLTDFDMDITCRPMNRSDKDKTNSELARRWLQALWKSEDMQEKLEDLANWPISCTLGYLLTLWDGRLGADVTPDEKDGLAGAANRAANAVGLGKKHPRVFVGDAVMEVVSPFEIVPDFTVTDFNKMTRFGRLSMHRVDYIKQKYDVTVEKQDVNFNDLYQYKTAALAFSEQTLKGTFKNHAVLRELFELPSAEYPKGLHAIISGKTKVLEEDLKYFRPMRSGGMTRFLPISVTQMIKIVGRLIGTNSVEQGMSPQTLYNRGCSAIMENANLHAILKILAPFEKIPSGAMSSNPDERTVFYNPDIPGDITVLQSPEMARYILNFINMLPMKIQDAFGLHDISMGKLPRRATTGPVVRFMGEQDDTRIASARKGLKNCVKKSFQHLLWITSENYTEERVVDLIGAEDTDLRIEENIKGSNFRKIDVDVEEDTALPRGSAQRADLAMAIVEKKLIPQQVSMLYKLMRARSLEDFEEILSGASQFDEVYAQIETKDMKKGIIRQVLFGENHPAHRPVHAEGLKDPKISKLARQILVKHIQDHDQTKALEAQGIMSPEEAAAARAQGAAPGAAPGAPALPAAQVAGGQAGATVPPEMGAGGGV